MGPSGDIEAGCSTGSERIVELGQSESQQQLLDHPQSQESQRGFGSQILSVLGTGPPREDVTDRDGQVELGDLINKPNQQSIREQTEVTNAQVGAHGQSSGTTSNVDSGARGGAANEQSHSQPDGLHQDKDRDVYEQNALRKCSEGWSGLSSNLKKYDEDKIKRVNDDMDTLLVFAGLFSAVVTAFCIEFYKSLQPDPNQTPAALLLQISRQLASFNANGLTLNSSTPAAEQSILTSMPPSRTSVNINIFWFLSLVFSLTTASLVILVKQWLREYLVYDTNLSPQPHIRVRHFRNEGMEKFRVFEIAAVLPMLLQIALGLFFIGLAIFLIDLDLTVGWSITPFIILWASLFVITLFTPAVFAHCPYHTPLLKGLLHATRHSLYKSMAYIYLLIHQKYARRPNRVTWDRLKLSATLATARYRLIISEGGWLHLVSRTCLHWGKWLLYSAPRCVFDSMVISIKWRFEEGYQADHPFLDEKRARNDASMDVTCLTTISVKFMDDEYLKLCFDATRNMRYKDMHGFYLSTRPPSFDEDYYYD
ncbi:hypothetical protein C8Q75DRAFT_250642 [Abortiporus biennis]|nr:hypothetical protein C8Q75DRAFT_250642 [Abortiporus biennis]